MRRARAPVLLLDILVEVEEQLVVFMVMVVMVPLALAAEDL
jgi:hypothetical protein